MVDQDYSNTMPNDNETRKTGNQLGKCCVCVCVCVYRERERERERSSRVWCTQWQSQDFSLKRAKLKDNIKSEINLKNINQ